MSKGTFTDFMNAMKNLESGVNYEFYQNGSQSAQQTGTVSLREAAMEHRRKAAANRAAGHSISTPCTAIDSPTNELHWAKKSSIPSALARAC